MAFFPLVLPRGRTAPSWPYPPSRAACGCGLPKPYKFILCHLINGQMQSSIVMSKIKRCVLTSRSWIFVRSCSRLPADVGEKIDPFHQHALNSRLGGPAVDMIINILERINDCLNWPIDDLLHLSLARKVSNPMDLLRPSSRCLLSSFSRVNSPSVSIFSLIYLIITRMFTAPMLMLPITEADRLLHYGTSELFLRSFT